MNKHAFQTVTIGTVTYNPATLSFLRSYKYNQNPKLNLLNGFKNMFFFK